MILGIILTIIQCINALCILFVLFFERQESTRRIMWLLTLSFLPGIGMVLYILLSGTFFTGSRRMKEVNESIKSITHPLCITTHNILTEHKDEIQNDVIKEQIALIDMNITHGDSILSYSKNPHIYTDGKDFFEDLCAALESAEKTINMEYFIFHSDSIGKRIMDILCKKASQGVDVKLLYDDLGSLFTRTSFFRKLNAAGGKARAFFPVRIGLPLTLNYRNHRKLTVIDSSIAFFGGINIGDEYQNKNKRYKLKWRDTAVSIMGNTVLDLQLRFLNDWYSQDIWTNKVKRIEEAKKYFPPVLTDDVQKEIAKDTPQKWIESLSLPEHIPTQIINSAPCNKYMSNIEDSLIRMLMNAKKTIYIQTPYFTPDDEFFTALKIASYAGVTVQIIIPAKWDKFYMKAASLEFAREILKEGVSIFLYPGFIHSKMISIDGTTVSIGTTNIDERSLKLHFEQNAFFYDKNFCKTCEDIFIKDRNISQEVTPAYFNKKPLIQRAWWSFCKLFSPIM